MLTSEIPLQFDMFSGQLVDNRTTQQKQQDKERWRNLKQMEMFSQKEIAQFGVSARPVMPLSPGKLVLISQDPRTEEEIEQDRLQQAEALTSDLFPALPSPISEKTTPNTTPTDQTISLLEDEKREPATGAGEVDVEIMPNVSTEQPSKYKVYISLVQAAEERAKTISNTPTMALAENIGMNVTKLNAQLAGLTGDEIGAALTIGDFRGRALVKQNQAETTIAAVAEDKELPILWTSRADMLKRRPDLTEQISSLREDEVADLAALVGEALEEFYWIQLNVVLALYLDHKLQLRKRKQAKVE